MIEAFFTPLIEQKFPNENSKNHFGGNIQINKKSFPLLDKIKIAIIGLDPAANQIRKSLYSLSWRFGNLPIADLGNIVKPEDQKQQNFAISEALGELQQMNIAVILLSGVEAPYVSHYHSYRNQTKSLEFVHVTPNVNFTEGSPLNQILKEEKSNNRWLNFDFIGTQSYFTTEESANILEKYHYENYRLGKIRSDIEEVEPVLRSSHSLIFDVSAIRHSELPNSKSPGPNGLYAEEAVAISRYAGLSNTLNTFLIHGYNEEINCEISTLLIAQMIWYFVEGVMSRFNDHPQRNHPDYLIYRNKLEETGHEITFYKGNKSNRWWMEIPNPYEDEVFFMGCSYNDYQDVCNGIMPERWWKAYKRMI